MKNTYSLLFYPKYRDLDTSHKAPIFLRITVDGKRSEVSVQRKIQPFKSSLFADTKHFTY